MTEQIKVTRAGAVETIAFANPPKNFITHRMLKELYAELIRVRQDPAVRALVLTGGFPDSFLTHYDVSELIEYARLAPKPPARLNDLTARLMSRAIALAHRHPVVDRILLRAFARRSPGEQGIYYWARCLDLLDTLPQPAIAAINGLSLGGGCEVALCCDFRFMARGPHYRIGLPEVLVGIIPGGTGTPLRLPRVVGEAKALEMLLTGKLYTPEEAQAMGLIHEAMELDQLMPRVMELAQTLSRRAPLAMAAAKRDIREGSRLSYPQGRAVDLAAVGVTMASADAVTGMSQYVNDLVAKYDGLDLPRMLQDAEDLAAGRLVQYQGK
ncbi:MAG TPA: enoyl-CoA hydratase/isomerase family protein [bacterium]|nr:enoyl-CoA hydratase/isomerase family protein [bacterium]